MRLISTPLAITAIALATAGLAACGPPPKAAAQKQIACKIMTDPGTQLTYTACPARKHSEANPAGDNMMIWWLLLNQQSQPAVNTAASTKGTTWGRTASGFTPPRTLMPTGTVTKVDAKTGEPEEETEEPVGEAEANGDEVTDGNSNASEAISDAGVSDSGGGAVSGGDANTGGGGSAGSAGDGGGAGGDGGASAGDGGGG